MPLISVIVPVYNTGPYLQEALQSILSQNVSDMEIICVNDGSTDDSLSILERMADNDPRIRIYSQQNQGQSVARNTGMLHATGRYIYFMDSDDILKENCFEHCIHAMESMSYDFIFFDGDILCEEGLPSICWNYHRTQPYEENKPYNGAQLMHTLLNTYTHRAVPWLLFIRHEYIKRIGLTFYPGIIHEDELYTTLLTIQAERVGCMKQNYVMHRVRANSTMTTRYSLRNVNCYLTVVDQLLKWGKSHPAQLTLLHKYARYTLDKVFRTAHVLPIQQKLMLAGTMSRRGYIPFVSFKNWLRFLLR